MFPGASGDDQGAELEADESDNDEDDCDEAEDDDQDSDVFPLSADDPAGTDSPAGRRAEEVTMSEIQGAILQALSQCPNQSCTIHSMTARVLKELGVLTRGNPRQEFEKRVMRSLDILERRERIEKYKAKNRRVRLLQRMAEPL